jgi:acetyltransferase-like isoleucine patch superfamily enzyme
MLLKLLKFFLVKKKVDLPFFLSDNKDFADKYSVGRYTYGLPEVFDFKDNNCGNLKIGSFCSISSNVKIFLSGNHRTDWVTTYPFNVVFPKFESFTGHPQSKGDVVIGNDVWIGMGSLILSGVKIGDGAVVGAGSIVTKDVPPYTIVAGNPAKIINLRFSQEEIQSLLRIQWWDRDILWIEENMHLLLNSNIQDFIANAR